MTGKPRSADTLRRLKDLQMVEPVPQAAATGGVVMVVVQAVVAGGAVGGPYSKRDHVFEAQGPGRKAGDPAQI